jgi:chitinase
MLPLLFVGIVLTCSDLLLGQASVQVLPNITVTITPAKATLFAGETQTFVAIVVGVDDQSVNWAVEEEDSGAITAMGLYTAPKSQGVYHITATSRARPQTKAVATVTVLAYCDPLGPTFKQ